MPDTTTHEQLQALIACHADIDHVDASIWQAWDAKRRDATARTELTHGRVPVRPAAPDASASAGR